MIDQLIFIYNANSGRINALLNVGHKVLKPSSYDCNLCQLTHGVLKEKEEWIRFRESVPTPFRFYHKDEFIKAYASKWQGRYEYPIVLAQRGYELEIAIPSSTCKSMTSLEELMREVSRVLASKT